MDAHLEGLHHLAVAAWLHHYHNFEAQDQFCSFLPLCALYLLDFVPLSTNCVFLIYYM